MLLLASGHAERRFPVLHRSLWTRPIHSNLAIGLIRVDLERLTLPMGQSG
jgi:hypothetical protein